jgi:hypothetical protein
MCECAAVLFSRVLPLTSLIWTGAMMADVAFAMGWIEAGFK